MRFVQFTRVMPADVAVYVNPAMVVAVDTFNSMTRIHTTATASDTLGPCQMIAVREPISRVLSELQEAANY
jgi:hypothetical protein